MNNIIKKGLIINNITFSTIKKSSIHGYGLFATKNIHKGSILGNLDGQIINWDNYDNIVCELKKMIGNNNYLFMEWNAITTSKLLVRAFRTKYSFINHSYNPNLIIKYNPIRLELKSNISINEEFTLDYSKEPLRKEYLEDYGKTYL